MVAEVLAAKAVETRIHRRRDFRKSVAEVLAAKAVETFKSRETTDAAAFVAEVLAAKAVETLNTSSARHASIRRRGISR